MFSAPSEYPVSLDLFSASFLFFLSLSPIPYCHVFLSLIFPVSFLTGLSFFKKFNFSLEYAFLQSLFLLGYHVFFLIFNFSLEYTCTRHKHTHIYIAYVCLHKQNNTYVIYKHNNTQATHKHNNINANHKHNNTHALGKHTHKIHTP